MLLTKPKDFISEINSKDGNDVSQPHIDYLNHAEQVQLVKNVYAGTDSSVQYIFQFPQESDATYKDRISKATLRNFVKRAVAAFNGMIFRKPLEYGGYGVKTTACLNTVDTKNTITKFSRDLGELVTRDGVAYVLADAPSYGQGNGYNKPYLILVERLALINWRKDNLGNYTMIVIQELIAEENGKFGTIFTDQWRHYYIDSNTGMVIIDIYRVSTTGTKQFIITDSITTAFEKIPIVEVFIDDVPIMYDIAKMNIKYLNRQSHKDRYLTMAALPIPVVWGSDIDEEGNTTTAKPALVIGVDEAFIFNGTKDECDFQWRELSGSSIDQLENDLNSIVEDITTGILRAAETANAVQKTATEVQLLQAEASNRVTVIADAVERGMQEALGLLSYLNNENIPEEAYFIINKDFNSALMGSDGARVVLESYLLGLISSTTFLKTLSDMELINIGSSTDELIRIENDTFVPRPRVSTSTTQTDNRTTSATNL